MKSRIVCMTVIASALLSTAALAQDENGTNTVKPVPSTAMMQEKQDGHGKRGPIDLERYSHMDELKAADTNHDGVLSRDEIEALALKRIVKREADRIERRLDVNGDGKISLEAIENQRKKEFAALDRNGDGKLDRRELRAAHKFGHGGHHHHWRHRHGHMKNHGPQD